MSELEALPDRGQRMRHVIARDVVIYAALVVAALVTDIVSPGFLGLSHIGVLLLSSGLIGFSVLGEMVVLLLGQGNIDLSIGPVIILTSVVLSGVCAGSPARLPLALVVVVGLAVLVGLANGVGVAYVRVPPLIMTLGMASVIEGGYFLYTGGFANGSTPLAFNHIWTGGPAFLPGAGLLWLIAAALLASWMHWGKGGRDLYFAGANANAARIVGINTRAVIVRSYVLAALLAMVSGLALTGYIGQPTLDYGTNETLTAITAAVLGGTTFEGGRGTVRGVVGGTLLLTVLQAILTILNMSDAGKDVLDGLVIIAVMVLYQWRGRGGSR